MGDSVGSIIGTVVGAATGFFLGGPGGALAGAGLGLSGGSTLIDQPRAARRATQASEAQAEEQRRIQRAQQSLSEAQNIRSRLAQVREARQQRAANLVRAVNTGGAEGTNVASYSPAAGVIGSVGSQLGSNVGFINSSEAIGGDIFRSNTNISNLRVQESQALQDLNMAKTIGGLGSTIFNMGGGFQTLFSQTPEVGAVTPTADTFDYGSASSAVSFYTGQ